MGHGQEKYNFTITNYQLPITNYQIPHPQEGEEFHFLQQKIFLEHDQNTAVYDNYVFV